MALVDDAEVQLNALKAQLQAKEITQDEYDTKRGEILTELEDELSCWICFEIYEEPVTLMCGHNYCRPCCVAMYQKNPLCAFCRRGYGLPIPDINQDLQQQALKFIALRDDEDSTNGTPMQVEESAFDMDIPDEVWLLIFSLLEANQLAQLRRVCRQWKRLSEDGYLWRNLCTSRWPFVSPVKHRNWQKCYMFRQRAGDRFTQGRPQDFKMFALRGHRNYITAFECVRNRVLTGSADNNLRLWNLREDLIGEDADDVPCVTFSGHTGKINCLQLTDRGVVSGSDDGTVRVWDAKSGIQTHQFLTESAVTALEVQGNQVFSTNNKRATVWDLTSRQSVWSTDVHQHELQHLKFLDSNLFLTSSTDQTLVHDIRNPRVYVRKLPGARLVDVQGNYIALANHQDVLVYNMQGVLQSTIRNVPANGIKLDGTRLATAGADNHIRIHDVLFGTLTHTLSDHTEPVNCVAFRGNYLVSGGADHCAKVWDLNDNRRMYSLLGGTRQARANNPPHPRFPGCSEVFVDEGRVVAAFNSLVRVYSFEDAVSLE